MQHSLVNKEQGKICENTFQGEAAFYTWYSGDPCLEWTVVQVKRILGQLWFLDEILVLDARKLGI